MTYPEFVESMASDASKASHQARLTTAALGLAGEAGELADEIKKHLFHGHNLTKEKLREKVTKELGDIIWYATFLMTTMNTTMEEVQEQNIKKLQERYKSGKFTAAESINRGNAAVDAVDAVGVAAT